MPILTANQRQELVDKRTQQTRTLTTYSSVSFQETLRQGVVDAQAVDDGIKAIYDFVSDDVIGNYYGERLNLDAERIFEDVNLKYSDSRLVVPPATFEDEVMTLGELSDDYLDIISEGIIARGSTTPFFTPTDVRRIFPLQGITNITRFEQFDGTPRIRDTISPNTWVAEPIVNAEKFFLFYEGIIASQTSGADPNGASPTPTNSNFRSVGSATDVLFNVSISFSNSSSSAVGVSYAVGQQITFNGIPSQVIVGNSGSVPAAEMSMGGGTINGTLTLGITVGNLAGGQRAKSLVGQTNNLNLERSFFVSNLNQGKSSTNLGLIDARLVEVVVGGSSNATNRTRRTAEISTRLADILTALVPFFERRYNSANQRANFADGTLGALKGKNSNFESFKVMISSDTSTITDGTEITRLKTSIANITSQIAFSDAN